MPWEFVKNHLPKWHDHPLTTPKKVRDALVPLVLVTRKEWGALPNNDEDPMELPAKYVRHVHTVSDPCTTREDCIKFLRDLQTTHMRAGMPDINWNFFIGGDGSVYEGRGWELDSNRDFERWQHIEAECVDIAYIGNYKQFGEDIPEIMTEQAKSLIQFGLDNKYIDCCYEDIPFDTKRMH